ncbi:sodium:glutamate symporter [Bacillus sp. HMF5848]|uniref:sodium/glutamate symporter n=1 Tax=Bacillus sp. HMF5848 TaxID=2495421 RepID=UPI000F78A91B|nr:sodium/glutamate symporter [Bacillus sp. HMF5848]RSK28786.1 sodium:glutamate symporter [Bacillus sp. HMF5848]
MFLISLAIIGVLLITGKFIRSFVPYFQSIFIPTSIIAGLLGLLLGEQVLGRFFSDNHILADGLFTEEIVAVWRDMPKVLITIIFASLFLGKKIPSPKQIWKLAGPQVSFGQTVAWGQYVLGLLLAIFVLTPFLSLPEMSGALIEISFQGGPGTAAGLEQTFNSLGFEQGRDLAVGLATIGVISGMLTGITIINWGIRKKKTTVAKSPANMSSYEKKGIYKEDEKPTAGQLTTRTQSIETLTVQFACILLAIGLGLLLQKGFIVIENATWGAKYNIFIFKHLPLFPLAMVGSVIVQLIENRLINYSFMNRQLIMRIQGLALDLLITSAIASLALTAIQQHWIAFLLLSFVGISWNIFAFIVLAPKMIPSYWFERGVVDLGQSMGMTTTGLMLLQIVDPEKETPSFESFGYKQLLFEPFVGGGFFTAASMPLIYQFNAYSLLIVTSILLVFWLMIGLFVFK